MLPTRTSKRKADYDYSQPGAYFVTVCVKDRKCLFGRIESGVMHPSPLGFFIGDQWRGIPSHYDNVRLDAWVVMPNHLHGILLIMKPRADQLRMAKSLSSVLGGFKAGFSREGKQLGLLSGTVLQPRFFDHIIRHERALGRIREYIRGNPAQWTLDKEDPQCLGVNEFYAWLEKYCRLSAELVKGKGQA